MAVNLARASTNHFWFICDRYNCCESQPCQAFSTMASNQQVRSDRHNFSRCRWYFVGKLAILLNLQSAIGGNSYCDRKLAHRSSCLFAIGHSLSGIVDRAHPISEANCLNDSRYLLCRCWRDRLLMRFGQSAEASRHVGAVAAQASSNSGYCVSNRQEAKQPRIRHLMALGAEKQRGKN